MKTQLTISTLLLCPLVLNAADHDVDRFTLGARLPFNISAKFGFQGGYLPGTNPGPPTGGGLNRNYDDGYVRVDADGSAGGVTWYWGYRDAAQVPGNDTLVQHASSLAPASSTANASNPQAGFEVAWLHELGRAKHFAYGFKLAFNYVNISISDNSTLYSSASQLTDTYSLGGIVAPSGGNPWQYAATYDQGTQGPAPLIDDHPVSRAIAPAGTASISGYRSIDADVFGFKLGPWIELPITHRISFQAGSGVAWGIINSTFRFNETLTLPDNTTTALTGKNTSTGAVVGAYAEAGFNFMLTKKWGVFALGEFQHFGDFTQSAAGQKVTLNLGQTWSLQTGISFSF